MNTPQFLAMAACIFAVVGLQGCASSRPAPREQANRFDVDGDGFLSPDEYSASALSGVVSFDELDTDGDGRLSRRELEFRMGRGSRGQGPRGGQGRGGGDRS